MDFFALFFEFFPLWLKKSNRVNVLLNIFRTSGGIMLPPLLSSYNNHFERLKSHFVTFLDLGPIFLDFSYIDWKKSTRANVLLNNFWTTGGIMQSPLLSSQNSHLLRSKLHFATFFDFGPIFLDFSYIDWKSPLGKIFCWITSGLTVGLCNLLFHPLKITTLRDRNHIF